MNENVNNVQQESTNDLTPLAPIGQETVEEVVGKDPNVVMIALKDVKLWKHIEKKKRELFKQVQGILNGIQDPLKLSRHNRRAFLRANAKFIILEKRSKALTMPELPSTK